jgi:hypothetical protein
MDRTIVAMITEVGNPSHDRNGAGAGIIGGKKLGMIGGQFKTVSGSHNQLWASIAQAYVGQAGVAPLMMDTYPNADNRQSPIAGLWAAPTAT